MSERKVLNKYYPPDFDPTKIPRVRQAKNRQFTVRLMAPFNMKCKTCGEYIYKGKKFNARKEDVENENYLGIRIYRFYIKCTRCLSEISFKTDPESTDYVIEAGATRNFMALKLAEEQAQREVDAEKEEESTNPMKLLENRTKASREEIERVEALEELKELNKRKGTINFDGMLDRYDQFRQTDINNQEMQDELEIRAIFGERTDDGLIIKRMADVSDSSDEDVAPPPPKVTKQLKPTDLLAAPATSSFRGNKMNLLVKPKSNKTPTGNITLGSSSSSTATILVKPKTNTTSNADLTAGSSAGTSTAAAAAAASTATKTATTAPKSANALSLLGCYSDSDSDS